MAKFIANDWGKFGDDICAAAGVEPTSCARLVIDLQVGHAAKFYIEGFPQDTLKDVRMTGDGVVIEEIDDTMARMEAALETLSRASDKQLNDHYFVRRTARKAIMPPPEEIV